MNFPLLCVILKDNNPQDVGKNVNNTFHFILPKKSISLNSNKIIIKFKKIKIDQKSFIYPFSSSRKINKLNKEEFDIEKSKKHAVEQLKKLKTMKLKCKKFETIKKFLRIKDICYLV